jgi:hypothetical protein
MPAPRIDSPERPAIRGRSPSLRLRRKEGNCETFNVSNTQEIKPKRFDKFKNITNPQTKKPNFQKKARPGLID